MSDPELSRFIMDTEIIPAEVDIELAARRNALINDWRNDGGDPKVTLRNLLDLYWSTQARHTGATGGYLMDSASEFPLEANIPLDDAVRIHNEAMEAADQRH